MHRSVLIGVLLVLGVVGRRAHAASTLSFQAAYEGGAAKVFCEGATVMTVNVSMGGGAAAERLAGRFNSLAESGLKASQLSVRKEGRARVITARGGALVTITRTARRSYGLSASALATIWLRNLQKQFRRPYLSAEPAVVPFGEARLAPVEGNLVGAVGIESDSAVATATWEAKEQAVRIVGREVGRATLTLSNAGNSLRLAVRVAKYAAQLDGAITATVTGNPASLFALEAAVAGAVQSAIHPEPGATCELLTELGAVSPPYPGRSVQVTMSVSADGPDYLPYRARPAVTVTNQPLTLAPVSLLMVSNSPEKLQAQGLWFEGLLPEGATRLLYHHVNATGGAALLTVELWNLGAEPARVHVLAGLGGPSYDELWVGHRATSEYFRGEAQGAGWVVTVPPGTAMTAFAQPMPRGSIVSGVAELRPLGPAKVSVRVMLNQAGAAIGLRAVDRYQPAPLARAVAVPPALAPGAGEVRSGGRLGLRHHRRSARRRPARWRPAARQLRRDLRGADGAGELLRGSPARSAS